MATIRTRSKADGSISYQAIIRLKRKGRIIHQETKSFSRERLAVDWARRREVELEAPGAIAKAAAGAVSLGDLIEWYVKTYAAVGKWGRTKHADLKRLQAHSISETSAVDLTDQMLVDHITKRRAAGAGPATALNDLVWIGVVLHAAKEARGLPVDAEAAARARETCKRLKLVRRSKERDRLPTYDELQRLDEHFAAAAARGREDIPMRQVMWFAIYSARRQEEITLIRRADDDAERMLGLVRDAKHPTDKDGNHRRFRYSPAAWHIAGMQPDGDRAFPYEARSISSRFTRACALLGIEDLHFHDLRHEATTRLFEWGLSIPEVATYTLHESWNVLKRYTHVLTGRRVFDAPFLPHNVFVRPGGFMAPPKAVEPARRRRTSVTKRSRAKR